MSVLNTTNRRFSVAVSVVVVCYMDVAFVVAAVVVAVVVESYPRKPMRLCGTLSGIFTNIIGLDFFKNHRLRSMRNVILFTH